ncbi:hypothetical protein RJT34_11215 [Clitoria ternatea]|uniref:Uncharacterized protein n=1 Tax=Clitoria ternatea TaxID=43366 RepID=A0AAN9JLI8_CLITE
MEEWVIQINAALSNSNGPSIPEWERHSIYKVPSHFTELHEKAYTPKAVSFGPYHNGEEHLKPMEEHKHRALIHFLKRCKKPIGLLSQRMEQVVQELRDSYKSLDQIWVNDTPKFLQMMILDGCFMLQILRTSEHDENDYAENDPIFGDHGRQFVVPYILRDMLMLENQLPMTVLRTLIEVETDHSSQQENDELLNKLILKFFGIDYSIKEGCMGKCKHVLDLYRKGRIQMCRKAKPEPTNLIILLNTLIMLLLKYATTVLTYPITFTLKKCLTPKLKKLFKPKPQRNRFKGSVRELHEAGIRFSKSNTDNLKDVTFDDGVLKLPHIQVDDSTRYIFLNLLAFERLHVGAGNEVTSYVYFMDNIIDTEADVDILHKNDILCNALECNKAVAQMFNSLAKDITVVGADIENEQKKMARYCRKWWKKWRANLIHTYFRNPWSTVSLHAAIFLFALTTVQTVFTVLPYYYN